MRFAFAILALVFSGVLLVLGIGQRTFLAGPAEIVVTAELPDGTNFASIPSSALGSQPGIPFIEVSGTGAFVSSGSSRDVAAWLAPVDHLEFSGESSDTQWESVQVTGIAEESLDVTNLDPRGSDLWTRESAGDTDALSDVRIPVPAEPGESVLVSVNTDSQSPSAVSLVWAQDTRTPFAGPLIVGGILFAILGVILYVLAVDHDRRGLGPRRGQKGPFWGIRNSMIRKRTGRSRVVKSKTAPTSESSPAERRALNPRYRAQARSSMPVIGLVAALALSGCSAQYWPDFSAETVADTTSEDEAQTSTAAPIPVTPEQIDRIVADIAVIASAADDALDAEVLSSRFTGDALAQRTANYTVRNSVPDYRVVPPRITDESLEYELVQSTEGWPRTVFVTVASDPGAPVAESESEQVEEAASPSLALIMSQATPHDNFLVSRVVALRGGITMPQAAPTEEGTALLSDDLQTLRLSPGEVGPAYAAILAGGTGVEQASLFNLEGDTLIERSGSVWATQSQATADAAGQGVRYSVAASQTEAPLVSLSTGVGGALVATTLVEERIEEPGSGRWKPTAPASVTALSGLSGQQDKLVSIVTHQLLFYVPGQDSDEKIQLLGYSSDLTGARNT